MPCKRLSSVVMRWKQRNFTCHKLLHIAHTFNLFHQDRDAVCLHTNFVYHTRVKPSEIPMRNSSDMLHHKYITSIT
jgi:hypothetical protein